MKGSAVHAEERGDLACARMTREQRGAKDAPYLLGEVLDMRRLECPDLLLQQASQFGIVAGEAMTQAVGGEHQRVLPGVEAQWSSEVASVWTDVLGFAAGEADLGCVPAGAAQLAHDVESHGDGAIPELIGTFDPGLVDGVVQRRLVVLDRQCEESTLGVKMEEAHEGAQGGSHVR